MTRRLLAAVVLLVALLATADRVTTSSPPTFAPDPVVWDSPSADARGSMPLGNGDITLNAWVDASSGDLLFYIGKSDTWEDNARLAKVGLVRVHLAPGLLSLGKTFRQVLDPGRGEMVVTVSGAAVRLWVDANNPVIHVAVTSRVPVSASASFELWRTSPVTLPAIEVSDVNNDPDKKDQQHAPTVVEPDTVLRGLKDDVGWLHHNAKSVGPVETMRHQDLLTGGWTDPILNRTFGAVMRAPGARRVGDRQLDLPGAGSHRIDVYVLTEPSSTPERWLAAMRDMIARIEAVPLATRERAHATWWRQFWERSHIVITSAPGATDPSAAADVTRGYALQRYITACAGRGAYPIKFNGSLFTVPSPGKPGDADYRRWGPGYWWQNTRLAYVPLLASGDFDLLPSLYRTYAGDMLAVARYRAKRYFGFDDAAYFAECQYFWGAVFSESYGWRTPASERTDKLQTSGWHKWEWVGGLEFVYMLQDYYDHTADRRFLRDTLLPAALPLVRFFDRFYQTGPDGKLVMQPSQSLETWWDCTNPMPEIAGLHAVITRLLALPSDLLPSTDRRYLAGLQARVPALPTREVDGVRMLAAADRFAHKSNIENPELYAVFPFRLVSFEKPDAALGIEALHRRGDRGPQGWRQEDIFMAYLGLADEARDYVVQRARKHDESMRFPAFWGPNYDWTPDQCHGGVLMKAIQSMLMQTDGRRIFLLPAWPAEWNADFKLHAPAQTVVEGTIRGGTLTNLHVTPESRRKDVTIVGPSRATRPGL